MTGKPARVDTKITLALVEKHARKSRKAFWKDLARRLGNARRSRVSVNVWKLGKMAKKYAGKTLVVPGKVLGTGEWKEKSTVVALEYSEGARAKIGKTGKALSMRDAVHQKLLEKDLVIVQ